VSILSAIYEWFDGRRRKIDIEILWPMCKEQATTLDDARAVFAHHALHDSAWRRLGEAEIVKRIGELS
jgi:hypothetical protein